MTGTTLPTAELVCTALAAAHGRITGSRRDLVAVLEAVDFITAQAAEIERLTNERDASRNDRDAWCLDFRKMNRRVLDTETRAADAEASLAAVTAERDAMREAGRYMVRVADYMREDPLNTRLKEADRVFLKVEMSSDICDEDAARAAISLDAQVK